MLLYKYEDSGHIKLTRLRDNDTIALECETDLEDADFFAEILKEKVAEIKKWDEKDFKGKRFLDIGMGNGNILHSVKNLLNVDIYGVDISSYLDYQNYIEGRTFTYTDICDLPKELLGTFDVAYQTLFSVPFSATSKVLLAASKALKEDGCYIVTFDNDYYEHDDSFVVKILKELYFDVELEKIEGKIKTCIASKPRPNPVLSPMESYYAILTYDEYEFLNDIDYDSIIKFLDMDPVQRKNFLEENYYAKK